MKSHEIFIVYDHGYIGRTWCGTWIKRSDPKDPWTTLTGEQIAGNARSCGNCRRAKAAGRPWEEHQTKEGTRHEIRPVEGGYGFTWCNRRVERGGSGVPWSFRSGQVATTGDRPCRVCKAAKAATERRRKALRPTRGYTRSGQARGSVQPADRAAAGVHRTETPEADS